MVARFLHHFPQYKLRDLQDSTLSVGEFFYLWGGMLDCEAPEATEPVEDIVARRTREVARAAHEAAARRM